MKPDFIGIGAQKCASTWLHRVLAEHPEVAVSEVKELDFFSYHFDCGYQWYEAQFPEAGGARLIGEFSPSYFHDAAAPERVHAYAPDVKLLLTLRDPVERALSNHRHEVRVGHLRGPDLSLETGLANNPMYVEQGRYASHLQRWLEWFPREQIFVALMDDIRNDPRVVAAQVFQFLGVDPAFVPDGLTTQYNRSFATRSRALTRVKDGVYALSQQPPLRWTWRAARSLGLQRLYRQVNVVNSEQVIPEPEAATLEALRAGFADDVARLEELLGRNLDHWKPASPGQARAPAAVRV